MIYHFPLVRTKLPTFDDWGPFFPIILWEVDDILLAHVAGPSVAKRELPHIMLRFQEIFGLTR